jgi:membrane dipeptidase
MIGVEGFDFLVKSEADLAHLDRLIYRGVKVFQPSYTATGLLAGSSAEGDDRGLLDLGRRFLEQLAESTNRQNVRVLVDLAHLNPRACGEVLGWLEQTASPGLIPLYSHGIVAHSGFSTARAITIENLKRLRALGGWIGLGVTPPFIQNSGQLLAAIEATAALPWRGNKGYSGIGFGTDFMGIDETLPELSTAERVVEWAQKQLPAKVADALLWKNGQEMMEMVINGRNSAV